MNAFACIYTHVSVYTHTHTHILILKVLMGKLVPKYNHPRERENAMSS